MNQHGRPFAGTKRFLVRQLIGRGGMGLVYRVHDLETGRDVALKTLRHLDAEQSYHLKEEFRVLRGIVHRNLVQLYELVVDESNCFFTMELVEGVDLATYVHNRDIKASHAPSLETSIDIEHTRIDPRSQVGQEHWMQPVPRIEHSEQSIGRLKDAVGQLVHGILALHNAGKQHRDIKPSNVMVTHEGRVVLLDFGVATYLKPDIGEVGADTVAGSLPYMAPEQMWGKETSTAADWYSLGITLYELLTGRLPFDGEFAEVLYAKEELLALSPLKLAPSVPEPLAWLTMDLLALEPAMRPSASKILRVLVDAPESIPPTPVTFPPDTPFVGRGSQLVALSQALQSASQGRRTLVRVEGLSGMGKTTLVRRFLNSIDPKGSMVVLRGRCHPQESVPYKAFDELMGGLSHFLLGLRDPEPLLPQNAAALMRLFPVLGREKAFLAAPPVSDSLDPQELRRRGFEAMRELLVNIACKRLLVLWMDDLQWGDVDSALLLQEILRGPETSSLLIILSYRSDAFSRGPFLRALDNPNLTPLEANYKVTVGPLEPDLAKELVQQWLATEPVELGSHISEIVQEAEGSPFFIEQLTQHILNASIHPPSEDPPMSARFSELMKERLTTLEEHERRILEVVCVAGHPLDRAVVLAAVGIGEAGRPHVQRLGGANLLNSREVNGRVAIETSHDRIRETVLAQIHPDIRRDCHLRLAQALQSLPDMDPLLPKADPENLAEHYFLGGDRSHAGHYAVLAAEQAEHALAFSHAVRMYSRAVELRTDDPDRWQLRAKLGAALANAGQAMLAGASYTTAAEELAGMRPSDTRVLDLQRRAAEQYLRSGHVDEGVAMLQKVLSGVGIPYPRTPQTALASVVLSRARLWYRGLDFKQRPASLISSDELLRADACWSAGLGLAWIDQIRTAAFQAHFMLLALDMGEPARVARALATEASQLACLGGMDENRRSDEVMAKANALATTTGDCSVIAFVFLMKGTIAFYRAHWKEALDSCQRAQTLLRERCRGTAWEMTTCHILSLASLVYLGETAKLQTLLPDLLRAARESGDLLAEASLASGLHNMKWLLADQPDEARRQANNAMARWPRDDFQAQHYFDLIAHTHIDLYEANPYHALERVQKAWPKLKAAQHLRVQHFRITLRHLRARCALAAATSPSPRSSYFGFVRNTRLYRDRLLSLASDEATRLASEDLPWAKTLSTVILGGIAAAKNSRGQAIDLLKTAAEAFNRQDMALYAAATRCQLGHLMADDAGRNLTQQAETWMQNQGIANPARIVAMLVPVMGNRHSSDPTGVHK